MEPKICKGFTGDFDGLDYLGMRPKRYISDKKIIITTDGRITKARFYDGKKLIKEASTRCHPDDEFDFATGAKLAFNRLVAKKKGLNLYNGKIVCVKQGSCQFKKGKIYTVRDGILLDEFGFAGMVTYYSLEQINNSLLSQFIELVED